MGRIFEFPLPCLLQKHDFLQKLDFQLFRMMEAEHQSDEVIRKINLKQHCCCCYWLNYIAAVLGEIDRIAQILTFT